MAFERFDCPIGWCLIARETLLRIPISRLDYLQLHLSSATAPNIFRIDVLHGRAQSECLRNTATLDAEPRIEGLPATACHQIASHVVVDVCSDSQYLGWRMLRLSTWHLLGGERISVQA